ncbi:E3 ubiquitin-protein ligase itt1 [Diplonema papillatum]|nr:E3 ubiquitin-protein ligase itt1 [Diplonema papillatum]
MPPKKKPFQSPDMESLEQLLPAETAGERGNGAPARRRRGRDTPAPFALDSPAAMSEQADTDDRIDAAPARGHPRAENPGPCRLGAAAASSRAKKTHRKCPSCSFSNPATAAECSRCSHALCHQCNLCMGTVVSPDVECAWCKRKEAGADDAVREIEVESDWPLFSEAMQWIREINGVECSVDASQVTGLDGAAAIDLSLPSGSLWPWTRRDENLQTVQEGDTVWAKPYDERMSHQRCGWGKHMLPFCGQEAVVKRFLVNGNRAQALLMFKHVKLNTATVQVAEDRRSLGWFDLEWLRIPEGYKLPIPSGGWYEKLMRFPLTVGSMVRVKPFDPAMKSMKCGWDACMEEYAGRAGSIVRILVAANFAQVQLAFTHATNMSWWDIEWLDIPPYLADHVKIGAPISTGLCGGKVTLRAETVRKCPRGHKCVWLANPYQGFGLVACEGCRAGSIRDEEVLHCGLCSFDLCSKCASGQRVLDRAQGAMKTLSTFVRVGAIPEAYLAPIAERLQQSMEYGRVVLRKIQLLDGRPAVLACVMGDANGVATMLNGKLLCRIHDNGRIVNGTRVTNPMRKIDAGILEAIERAFHCCVVTPPPGESVHPGTVALLGPEEERIKAAGKLVWYSASRRIVIRVHPAERGVVQQKVAEIRARAKCHVSLYRGTIVKLIGLPSAIKAARAAINNLLLTHRMEIQSARVSKAMALVVSELCEVRLAIRIADPLIAVLSQLHEPQAGNDTATSVRAQPSNNTSNEQHNRTIRSVQAELNEIHRVAVSVLEALDLDASGLSLPSNIAGLRAYQVGDTVVRGPDWKWEDQDGGAGQVGRVFDFPIREQMEDGGLVEGWISVEWPNRGRFNYKVGHEQDVVHAVQEGENEGEDGNYEEELPQRCARHKQVYINLVNAVGTLEARHVQLLATREVEPTDIGSKRDTLQQFLHQTTRDKARVEHRVSATAASLSREEERAKKTLQMTAQKRGYPGMTAAQVRGAHDLLVQHLENLRSLRARMQRHADHATMQLIARSAKIRRELAEVIKRQKFSGWDIILSIMQETGALIEYRSGDNKLVLTGGESAVYAARRKLRSLTVRDLYAWSCVTAQVRLPVKAYKQVTKLQGLLARVVEQVSGVEAVRPVGDLTVAINGTFPQIENAVDVLRSRLDLSEAESVFTIVDATPGHSSPDQSLVLENVTVKLDAECDVCGCPLDSSNTLTTFCGHVSTCTTCLRLWVDSKISERQPAVCPSRDCGHVLTAGEYRSLVAKTGAEGAEGAVCTNAYEVAMAKEKLKPQVRQCYACEDGFAVRSEDTDMLPICCVECRANICANATCSEPAHYFLDCNEVVPKKRAMLLRRKAHLSRKTPDAGAAPDAALARELSAVDTTLDRLEEASKTQEVLQKEMAAGGETRPCPACGALVHKTGGCNSMTCTCGQKFCHQCLQTNCELVEITGSRVPCDPNRLCDRVDSALAAHRGNSVYEGWVACDVCDTYPIPKDSKVYACSNCANWYVCEACEAEGKAEQQHPRDHLLVEVAQAEDLEEPPEPPPVVGPDYDIDWEEALAAAAAADEAPAGAWSERPGRDPAEDEELTTIPAVAIEPITPVTRSLDSASLDGEPPVAADDGFDRDVGELVHFDGDGHLIPLEALVQAWAHSNLII